MEKKKIDKIIEAFRRNRYLKEDGIVNAVGNGGYTGSGDPLTKGGVDPLMPMPQPAKRDLRTRKRIKLTSPGLRARWRNRKKS